MTPYEREVLEWVAGRRKDLKWGAWVSACLEFLGEDGYISRGAPYHVTDKGRAYLDGGKDAAVD